MNDIQLYKKIIRNISKEVKRILNEDIQKFDVTGYPDEDIINNQDVSYLIDPKTLKEEEALFIHTEPSDQSREKAEHFLKSMKYVIDHLNNSLINMPIPKECLKANKDNYELYGCFTLFSKNEDTYIDTAFEYTYISISYNTVDEKFYLSSDKERLAKMIEYSDAYESSMVFSFIGDENYFSEFQKFLSSDLAECIEIWIWPKGFYHRPEYNDREVFELFSKIYTIYVEFIYFTEKYITKYY